MTDRGKTVYPPPPSGSGGIIIKKIGKCYTIFTGASKNRLYHLFQLVDEDLEGFKAACSGNIGWQ
jgi:hypothetical protein